MEERDRELEESERKLEEEKNRPKRRQVQRRSSGEEEGSRSHRSVGCQVERKFRDS